MEFSAPLGMAESGIEICSLAGLEQLKVYKLTEDDFARNQAVFNNIKVLDFQICSNFKGINFEKLKSLETLVVHADYY